MKTVVSIQALRAIAALSVAFCHFGQEYNEIILGGQGPGPFFCFAGGVDLFFVISGFVMVYSSEALFGARGASTTFMRHRLARIVPIYWVTTTIWLWLGQPFDLVSVAGSYLFIPYLHDGGSINPLYGVGWTLNFEMFFYAVFAPCLCFARPRAVALLAGALLCAVAAGRLFGPMPYAPLVVWTDPLVLEFLAGAAIAVLYRRGVLLPNWLRVALIVAAVITIFQFRAQEIEPYRWAQWGIPAAAIVAASVLGTQRGLDGRLGYAARKLGDASYSLYLLHILVHHEVRLIARWFDGPVTVALVLMAGYFVTVALALATYRYFERPLTNALKGISPALRPRLEAA